MAQLASWAQKHTTAQDLIVLEASGNSFQVVRTLAALGRPAKVLESCQMGKLKEAHANNDKISAVRIGKAYLAGTAKEVWVPDPKTQEWRDWFHAYHKAVKRTTQMRARLRSYLSDNGVRLKASTRLTEPEQAEAQLRQARSWSERQWQVIEILLADLRHADQQRQHWHQPHGPGGAGRAGAAFAGAPVRRAGNHRLCPGRFHRGHSALCQSQEAGQVCRA